MDIDIYHNNEQLNPRGCSISVKRGKLPEYHIREDLIIVELNLILRKDSPEAVIFNKRSEFVYLSKKYNLKVVFGEIVIQADFDMTKYEILWCSLDEEIQITLIAEIIADHITTNHLCYKVEHPISE